MKSNYEPLGKHIRLVDYRNSEEVTSTVLGISIDKEFMPSVANVIGTDLSRYKLISKGLFACNPMHVGRDERLPIALYEKDSPAIVSPAYFMFEIIDRDVLNEEYLMMWFRRPEFDRECWFMTDGSVRGGITWDDLCRIKLPVPSYARQCEIVESYRAITDRIALKRAENDNLVATVTAIYRRMFIEGGRIYPTAPLKQLCSKIGSGATPKGGKTAYQESGVSLVRSTNVFDYAFSYDDLAHISDEQADQLSNVIVEENDVLFNITGVSVTRCCIVPSDVLPARVNQHVMILRPKTAMPMSYYIMTTLCSAENKGKLMGIAQSGSTREAINKQEMESFSIPVPPTKEVQDFEIKARGLYESVIRNTEEIMRLNVMQQLLLSQLSSR